ncbi:hypothetical protein [Bradyrhizobium erythrophlei]|jgi:hypothetical protein|uniref:Uncharacterized protein n=1 Tax=Bradyrhizobium erythrophlei TaxID=1437360 RepID=A0A1M5R9Y3_9BRAD|nr:hypothetical protein [Bradyrhizobium erythrophlei]SHH23154.1 hypothetical protein SAMN05443248_4145 [Bradyrhizobium erythrophlei]
MAIENLRDENLLRFYDNIREQVEADKRSLHKFAAGQSVKEYAEALRGEMIKRRLQHTPIDWDRDQCSLKICVAGGSTTYFRSELD